MEEVPEAAVEEHLEDVGGLVTGGEEEVEVAEEDAVEQEVVVSAHFEGEEGEGVTRILQEQGHSEGAVHSHVKRSSALHVQFWGSLSKNK